MDEELEFGEWLEDLYIQLGFTQSAFAEAVGVAQTTVSGWVNGQRPRRRAIPAIARALGRSEREVLQRAGYTARGSGVGHAGGVAETQPRREESSGSEIDLDDPLLEVSTAYGDRLTLEQKRAIAELIKTMVREGEIEL